MAPLTILTGHFGSGKTEISLNLALKKGLEAKGTRETALIDLDLVNPYFRSREAKAILEDSGIRAVLPEDEVLHTDLPVIPSGVFEAVKKAGTGGWEVIIDLGGDDQGALVLGHLRDQLLAVGYELWVVVNPYRPFNQDAAGIIDTVHRIEAAGRIKVTGLISNPHLAGETTREDILEGHKVVLDAARTLELPVRYLVVMKKLADELRKSEPKPGVELLTIDSYLRPDWFDLD